MHDDGSSQTEEGDRVQVCGRLAATIRGQRIEEKFKSNDERLLFVYLILNRLLPIDETELASAIWPEQPPSDSAVRRLLRRLRRVLGARLELRPNVQLRLPVDSFVDIELAAEAVHRAEAAVA